MEYDLVSIGKRITEIREDLRLTKENFGNSLGVTSDAIYNLENARNKTINMPLIIAISAKYSYEENWILYGNEPRYSNKVNVLEKLKDTYNLSDLEYLILSGYLKLDKTQRVAFENFVNSILNPEPPTKTEESDEYITTVAARGNSELKVKIKKSDVEKDLEKPMSTGFDD